VFTDPQSVTINSIAVSLPRVSSETNKGVFRSSDNYVTETASHTYGNRTRRPFRIDHSKIVPDPLVSTQNNLQSASFYLVADVPKTGYTVAEQKQVLDGLIAQLNASSGALITKWLGGEN